LKATGIGIIHNPKAKGNIRYPERGKRLKEILGLNGLFRETQNLREMEHAAREFHDKGINVVGINGGDGTMHHTLTALIRVYGEKNPPAFLHLRGGTMNTLANSFGVQKGEPEPLLKILLDKVNRGDELHVTQRNIIRINDVYGFIFGAGFAANFLELYYDGGDTGSQKAFKVIFKGIGSGLMGTHYSKRLFANTRARVIAGGKEIPFDAFTLILATTIRNLGVGAKPGYMAEDKKGYFHFVGGNTGPLRVIRNLPRMFTGRKMKIPMLHDSLENRVVIKPLQDTLYIIDGEVFSTSEEMVVKTGPLLDCLIP
jgi:diacylglycerol kinase (ATP)